MVMRIFGPIYYISPLSLSARTREEAAVRTRILTLPFTQPPAVLDRGALMRHHEGH